MSESEPPKFPSLEIVVQLLRVAKAVNWKSLFTCGQIEYMFIAKNLCYAFIYADGVTLRAWWTLDGILFTCGEDRNYLKCEVFTSEVHLYVVSS